MSKIAIRKLVILAQRINIIFHIIHIYIHIQYLYWYEFVLYEFGCKGVADKCTDILGLRQTEVNRREPN